MSLIIDDEQVIHEGGKVGIKVNYEDGAHSISVTMYHAEVDIMLFACVDPPINHLPFINMGVLNIS